MAPAGLWLARRIPNPPLMIVFSLILAWVGIQTLRRTFSPKNTRHGTSRCHALSDRAIERSLIWNLPCAHAFLTGLLSGLLSGLLGVGGGFVIAGADPLHEPEHAERDRHVARRDRPSSRAAALRLPRLRQHCMADRRPVCRRRHRRYACRPLVAARLAGERLQQGFAVTCPVVASLMIARVAGWLS